MNTKKKILWNFYTACLILLNISCLQGKSDQERQLQAPEIIVGAANMQEYLPTLYNKNIAVVANQTSMLGKVHLVDTLLALGIRIKCVFAPEHGFRGEAGAGQKIKDGRDMKTGLTVISLYGKHLKPNEKDLEEIDLVIFDIQDVGTRFYTYISTLQYVMEACGEYNKLLLILDRPNPNGFYVDGPVLQKEFRSFVGMAQIPVVHGMTVGEYALMLCGEKWLNTSKVPSIKVVKVENYSHHDLYQLPIRPSPNLPNMRAVYLYPSLCFFEGAAVSVGRGTDFPFQCYGYPNMKEGAISFTPKSIPGFAENPPYRDTLCKGMDLRTYEILPDSILPRIQLKWLISAYTDFPDKKLFFNPFFEKLAGNSELRKQIVAGASEEEIRSSWEPELSKFKKIRKKYLLYPDFEH